MILENAQLFTGSDVHTFSRNIYINPLFRKLNVFVLYDQVLSPAVMLLIGTWYHLYPFRGTCCSALNSYFAIQNFDFMYLSFVSFRLCLTLQEQKKPITLKSIIYCINTKSYKNPFDVENSYRGTTSPRNIFYAKHYHSTLS